MLNAALCIWQEQWRSVCRILKQLSEKIFLYRQDRFYQDRGDLFEGMPIWQHEEYPIYTMTVTNEEVLIGAEE